MNCSFPSACSKLVSKLPDRSCQLHPPRFFHIFLIARVFTLVYVAIILPTGLNAQGIDHEWVNSWGSYNIGHAIGKGVGVDAAGYTYASGIFSGTIDADPGPALVKLVGLGSYNSFICKFTPTGSLVWAKALLANSYCRVHAQKTDAQGNTYVSGYFEGTADFDPTINANLKTTIYRDLFLAKYDSTGSLLWINDFVSSTAGFAIYENEVLDIHLDGSGNAYLTGHIETSIDFDAGVGVAMQTPISAYDAFVAKYDAAGNHVLSFTLAGTSGTTSLGNGITVDASGNIYVTGGFEGTIDLNPGVGTQNITSLAATGDAFVAKYSNTGAFTWGFRIGASNSSTKMYDLALDAANNPTVIGSFSNTVDFDPSGSTYNLTASSGGAFVVKYSTAGVFMSITQLGSGGGFIYGENIEIASNGDIFISTSYGGTQDFNPGGGTYNLASFPLTTNMGFARYTSAMGFVWAFAVNPPNSSSEPKLALGPNADPHYVGRFAGGTVDFDPGAGTNNLTSLQMEGCFVGKYTNAAGAHVWAKAISMAGTYVVAYSGNENKAMTSDVAGNVYSTGTFHGIVDFDPGPAVVSRTSIAYADLFVTKHDPAGQLLWVYTAGGYNSVTGQDIGLDLSGNIFVTGTFVDTIDFDPSPATLNLISAGTDAFLLKLSPAGTISTVAKVVSGTSSDIPRALAIDANGLVYISGQFSGTADFDPSPATVNLVSSGTTSGFLAKYDNACGYLGAWAIDAPSGSENLPDIKIDGAGKIWVVGNCNSTSIDLDPGVGVVNPAWLGTSNTFVARYEPNGILISHFAITGAGATVSATSMDLDPWGDLVVAGGYFNNVDFDPGPSTVNITSQGSNEGYVAKYGTLGSLRWVRQIGGAGTQVINTVEAATDGSILTAGYATSEIDIDPGPAIVTVPGLINDIFLIRMDSAGTYQGSMVMGDIGGDLIYDIEAKAGNMFYVAGVFSGEFDFDPGVGVDRHSSNGIRDILLGKYSFACPTPAQPNPISGNTFPCVGTTNTYAVTAVPGATSYIWTLPVGWTGSSTSNSISATAGSAGGTITVTATNACGNSTVRSLTVGVNTPPPSPSILMAPSQICINSNVQFAVMPVPGATSYTWTLPVGWTGSSTTDVINVFTGSSGGPLTVTANNACGASTPPFTSNITLLTTTSQPGPINGPTAVCAGATVTYSVTPVPGASGYQWSIPSGWTGSSTTNTITVVAGSVGGVISVNTTNFCGNSLAQSLNVTITALPSQPVSITGNDTVCTGSTNTYTITAVPGATGYTWTLPNGWTGTSSSNSITAGAGANGGTISVTATNACGISAAQSIAVTVNAAPAQLGNITGITPICAGSTNFYSISPVPGATSYTWTVPVGWTGSSASNSVSASANANSGTISVTANNACGSSASQTLPIVVHLPLGQIGSLTGDDTICVGSTNTYNFAAVPNANIYTWTLPVGWTGSSLTNSISATAGNAGGTISVMASNACGNSAAQTLNVAVTPAPFLQGSVTGNAPICEGTTNTYTVTPDPNASNYFWLLPGGWSGNSTTNSITTVAGSVGGTVSVMAINGCGSSNTVGLPVNVFPNPTAGFSSTSNQLSVTFTNTSSFAFSWNWDFGDGNTSTLQHPVHTYPGPGSYNVCLTASDNNCSGIMCQVITVTQVGRLDGNDMEVSVSPNPSHGLFQLDMDRPLQGQVTDMHGKLILMDQFDTRKAMIDLSSYANGIYYLQLTDGDQRVAIRLVKVAE